MQNFKNFFRNLERRGFAVNFPNFIFSFFKLFKYRVGSFFELLQSYLDNLRIVQGSRAQSAAAQRTLLLILPAVKTKQ